MTSSKRLASTQNDLGLGGTDLCFRLLQLFDFHHLGTLVVPTVWTHSVRMFGLVAMRALGERLQDERVMCPAFTSPALRMSSLGVCHFRIISFVVLAGLVGLAAPSSQVEQIAQCLPSRVSIRSHATAASHVAIDPAVGTQAFAIGFAKWLHRKCKNDLLPSYVRQVDLVISIEAHRKLVFTQTTVVLSCRSDVLGLRQVKKVQILANLYFERSETPIASELDMIRYDATRQPKCSLVMIRSRDATDNASGLR